MTTPIANNPAAEILEVNTNTSGNNADPISMREYAGAHFLTPASLDSNTTITWYACDSKEGTYKPLRDSSNTAVTQSLTADSWHSVHPACNACFYIKPQTDNSAIQLTVTRKSGG